LYNGYNYELYGTFNEPNVVTYIKVKRLAWAGHLVPMNNDRRIKNIFNTKPDGVGSWKAEIAMGGWC
jgi:hypothetical protein